MRYASLHAHTHTHTHNAGCERTLLSLKRAHGAHSSTVTARHCHRLYCIIIAIILLAVLVCKYCDYRIFCAMQTRGNGVYVRLSLNVGPASGVCALQIRFCLNCSKYTDRMKFSGLLLQTLKERRRRHALMVIMAETLDAPSYPQDPCLQFSGSLKQISAYTNSGGR